MEIVKTWLSKNDKETDNKIITYKQINEVLIFIVYDIEKMTHKMVGKICENVILSAVGYEVGDDNNSEK